MESLRVQRKLKEKKRKARLAAVELSLGEKLSLAQFNELKRNEEEALVAVSKDITSFNRLIHSFEDRMAEMNKKIVTELPPGRTMGCCRSPRSRCISRTRR